MGWNGTLGERTGKELSEKDELLGEHKLDLASQAGVLGGTEDGSLASPISQTPAEDTTTHSSEYNFDNLEAYDYVYGILYVAMISLTLTLPGHSGTFSITRDTQLAPEYQIHETRVSTRQGTFLLVF